MHFCGSIYCLATLRAHAPRPDALIDALVNCKHASAQFTPRWRQTMPFRHRPLSDRGMAIDGPHSGSRCLRTSRRARRCPDRKGHLRWAFFPGTRSLLRKKWDVLRFARHFYFASFRARERIIYVDIYFYTDDAEFEFRPTLVMQFIRFSIHVSTLRFRVPNTDVEAELMAPS